MLTDMPWRQLSEIARYPYRGTKKRAQRRIHKIERQQAKQNLWKD